jgi:ABC-2 type transport system ATP-binding protein
MAAILECFSLTKQFGPKIALSNVDLHIEKGRITGLLGPNGSGKSTFLKICNGLLTPTSGKVLIDGRAPGVETKALVSYLPEQSYLNDWMRACDILGFFRDFYPDFDYSKALDMLASLGIDPKDPLKSMSKGTKEKVQLILVMARQAQLYLLDEPIGGVDPAARDYILNTIIKNYNPDAAIVISTHLIADIERVLDDVIFLSGGRVALSASVDDIRETRQMSVDALFREEFKC